MEMFGGSGDPTVSTVKDKESFSNKGQTAGINWDRSTLQATSVHILTQPQHTSEYNQKTPQWETSIRLVQIQTGQSLEKTSVAGGKPLLQKYLNPKNAINHIISNDDSCISNNPFYHPNALSAPLAMNSSQQPVRMQMFVNSRSLEGNWNNSIIPQHVNTCTNLSNHCIQQEMRIHNGNIRPVILTPDKVIKLQDICMSKENNQQKYVPQKAIAVVTPLKQQVAGGVTQSNVFTNVNERGLEPRSVPKKPHHLIPSKTDDVQTDIPNELLSESIFANGDSQQVETGTHANAKEFSTNGLKSLNNAELKDIPQELESESISVPQSAGGEKHPRNEEFSINSLKSLDDAEQTNIQHGFQLQTIPASGVFQHVEAEEQTEQLSSKREKSVTYFSMEKKIQSSQIEDLCSTDVSDQHDGHNSAEETVTGLSSELPDKASTIPVTEWSLQRLHTLIIKLEQMEKQHQKDLPFSCLTQEILKLYWNGDYQNLCNKSKSRLYVNIMKEVILYNGKKDSVILKAISKEKMDQVAAEFHILKHDDAPPKTMYKSTWLNLSEKPPDIDDNEYSSLFMTSRSKPKLNDGLEKVQRNFEKFEKEKTDADKKTNAEVEQPKPLPPEHERPSGVLEDKVLRTEPLCINNENKETNCVIVGQEGITLSSMMSSNNGENVIIKSTSSEELTETEDNDKVNNFSATQSIETSLQESSGDNLPAVSGCQMNIEQGKILPPLTSAMNPQLDKSKNAAFDPFACVQISILSPDESKEVFAREPKEKEVYTKQDNLNSKGLVITDLSDQSGDKIQTKTEMKTEKENKSLYHVFKITQTESYCCVAKWFKVLGYRNRGHCMCEQKAILNDSSVDEIKIVDVISDYQEVLKIANAVSESLTDLPHGSQQFTENSKCYRSDTSKKGRTHHNSCSQHAFDKSLHLSTDNASLRLNGNGKEFTTPEDNTDGKTINLALYGSSHLRQKKPTTTNGYLRKGFSGIRTSNTVLHPPETLNIRVGSDCNKNPSTSRKKNAKQRNLSACKKSYMSSKKFVNESEKQKCTISSDSEKNAADKSVTSCESSAFDLIKSLLSESTKYKSKLPLADQRRNPDQSKERLHSTREDKIRKLKQKRKLALLKRQNCVNDKKKTNGSLVKQPHTRTESKDDSNLALDFRVLPDSFNLSESVSSMEADQSASADFGSNAKNITGTKRPWRSPGAWCVSPKKKRRLESSVKADISASSSTFLEFKRKYEKKQRLPN
ncbi:uncharacterized protein si:ch211-106e7.2 [Trichomycterus rosablanca]|uniref:uncharacterized protein si:ch211-106e7.2 n=1 Tax=Trichomycterus rosablanca TaxID=2290929 RepID=UPI002F35ACFA